MTPADIQICQFSVTLRVCNSLSFRLCERISRMYTSITHTWLQRRPSLSLIWSLDIHPFCCCLQCAVSSLPTPSSPVPLFVFLSALSSNAEEQTTIFSIFSSSIAPLESHADIYRQLMFRFFIFHFLQFVLSRLGFGFVLKEMSLRKMILKNVFLFHWNAAPLLSLAALWLTSLSTPKNQSARQISMISK